MRPAQTLYLDLQQEMCAYHFLFLTTRSMIIDLVVAEQFTAALGVGCHSMIQEGAEMYAFEPLQVQHLSS